jgi:phage-related protein
VNRRWRDYRTARGRRPVREFIAGLSGEDAASVLAAMLEIRLDGLRGARHLRGDIYEVRADGEHASYRILFATEGRRGQVLLALVGFAKKSQKTPAQTIRLAQTRLTDWRRRGRLG